MAKVITLKQPWAQLVVTGWKQFETRGWRTDYTGELFIHSSLTFSMSDMELALTEPFKTCLGNPHMMRRGFILGSVMLEYCMPVEELKPVLELRGTLGKHELAFGDYSAGRWAWKLSGPKLFKVPVFAKGSLSIWDYPGRDIIDKEVYEQLTIEQRLKLVA